MTEPVVLHISTARSWRGGEQQLAYLVGELKKMNVKQYVLCVKDSAVETYCRHSHIPYFSTEKRSSVDIFFASRIASICRKNKIELIHTHDSHAHTFSILACDFFGCRSSIIVSRRVDFPVSKSAFSRYKYNHRKVKRILCVSDKIREITSGSLKDPSKILTVHSGIDYSRFAGKTNSGKLHTEYSLDSSMKLVGNVAALAPHKDYFTFVDAAAILCRKNDNICFFIIGDGPLQSEIKAYVKKSGFASRIIMTGFRTDIPEILPELDVFLITSETEGLGTTILDAFACRVPVVATAAGGIPEIVVHEHTGLLASVKDSVSLAKYVEIMLADLNFRDKIIENASEHLTLFTTSATAEKTLACYREVSGAYNEEN